MSWPHPVSISHLRLWLVLTGAAGGPLATRLAAHGTVDGLGTFPAVRLGAIGGVRANMGTRTGDPPAVRLAATSVSGRLHVVLTQGAAFDLSFHLGFVVELAAALHTAGS